MFKEVNDFYASYGEIKRYRRPVIKKKQMGWYDREYWWPTKATANTRVLELGCGTGEFLSYLEAKGLREYTGIDADANALAVLPDAIRENTAVRDIDEYLEAVAGEVTFDHIVMLDVLEHFSLLEAANLMQKLHPILTKRGLVVVRVPNMGSPFGGMIQYSDLTHKTAFAPNNLGHLAAATGFEMIECLPQIRGPWIRRKKQDLLFWLMSRMMVTSPEIWTPNLIAIFREKSI